MDKGEEPTIEPTPTNTPLEAEVSSTEPTPSTKIEPALEAAIPTSLPINPRGMKPAPEIPTPPTTAIVPPLQSKPASLGSLSGNLQSGGGRSFMGAKIPPKPATPSTPPKSKTSPMMDELRKQNAESESLVRPIRTYKDDISEVIKHRKTSVVSAAAAEAERRAKKIEATKDHIQPKKSNVNYMIGVTAVFFFIIGAGIMLYAYFFREQAPGTVNVSALPKLVFSESQKQLDLTNATRRSTITLLSEKKEQENMRLGALLQLYPVKKSISGKNEILAAPDFFKLLGIEIPGTLARTLDPQMMLGLHAFNGNQYFIVLKVKEYDRGFAGMLEWEKTIEQDLFPVFGIPLIQKSIPSPTVTPTPTGTTTSTTTGSATNTATTAEPVSSITTDDFLTRAFVDIVVKNINARALKRADGSTAFLYAFPDKNTIVITTTEPTLTEIITRMQSIRI